MENIMENNGRVVNLTPHDVVIVRYGKQTTYPSQGVARVSEKYKSLGFFDGIEQFDVEYGEIVGLPEPTEGVLYVVSGRLKDAAKKQGRTDTRSPAETVRDPETGHVLYTLGLLV